MFSVFAGSFAGRRRLPVGYRAAAVALLVGGLAIPAALSAQDGGPAVSAPNGKFSVEGGFSGTGGSGLGLGSYTLPLGQSFGIQFDGALGSLDSNVLYGGGVHIFTRDPSRYLLGLYGSYHTSNGIDIWRTAGEFQLFGDRASLEGLAGIEGVEFPGTSGGLPVINQSNTHFFGQANLDYYPTDDLRLSAGVKYADQTVLGTADAEYLLHGLSMPVSVFVDGQFGQSNDDQVMGGVRGYVGGGPTKTLLARQRHDDPPNYTPVFPNAVTVAATGGPNPCAGKNPDDHNACTIDSCDILTGNTINTPIACNDGNPNTIDTCDVVKGCVFTPIALP